MGQITIEISALAQGDSPDTPFIRIQDLSELVIARDGLMLRHVSGRSALLLPQVAAQRGWTVEELAEAVCVKAGLSARAWQATGIELFRFTAQVFGDMD